MLFRLSFFFFFYQKKVKKIKLEYREDIYILYHPPEYALSWWGERPLVDVTETLARCKLGADLKQHVTLFTWSTNVKPSNRHDRFLCN